jgi:hypothetical protein
VCKGPAAFNQFVFQLIALHSHIFRLFVDGFFSDVISRTPPDVAEVGINADATWHLRAEQPASTSQSTQPTADQDLSVGSIVVAACSHA